MEWTLIVAFHCWQATVWAPTLAYLLMLLLSYLMQPSPQWKVTR